MSVQPQGGKCGGAPVLAQPILNQRGKDIQPYGTEVDYQNTLSEPVRKASVDALNQILADSIYLRDMYQKNHWQVTGPTFHQMYKLFHKHYHRQSDLVQKLGKRVQMLGGVSVALPHDVVERTRVERSPIDREQLPVQISRLLEAHAVVLRGCHEGVRIAEANHDDGTLELLADHIIRSNEKQVWKLAAHLTDTPLVCAIR
jgi:starvation-inducible DNA-binding protein